MEFLVLVDMYKHWEWLVVVEFDDMHGVVCVELWKVWDDYYFQAFYWEVYELEEYCEEFGEQESFFAQCLLHFGASQSGMKWSVDRRR